MPASVVLVVLVECRAVVVVPDRPNQRHSLREKRRHAVTRTCNPGWQVIYFLPTSLSRHPLLLQTGVSSLKSCRLMAVKAHPIPWTSAAVIETAFGKQRQLKTGTYFVIVRLFETFSRHTYRHENQ